VVRNEYSRNTETGNSFQERKKERKENSLLNQDKEF
jgi:hypothetical protein